MISGTYLLSAGLLTALAWVFLQGWANAVLFTLGLTIVFFFASAAASSGYMTVSETFPLEIRAQAIAFFYIVGTLAGGVVGPWLFGNLINAGDRASLFIGYLIGSALMATGGIVEIFLGFRAEQRSLEDITDPLSVRLAKESEGAALHGPLGIDPTDVEAIRQLPAGARHRRGGPHRSAHPGRDPRAAVRRPRRRPRRHAHRHHGPGLGARVSRSASASCPVER